MRDLYRPLGLNPAASDAEIRQAISRYTGSEFSRDVFTEILLNPRRRKVYDRAWTTLHSLGRVRANLRLKDDAWESRNHDFTAVPDGWPTFRIQQDALRAAKPKATTSTPVDVGKKGKGTSKRTFIVPAVAIGIILIGYILHNPSSNTGRNTPASHTQPEEQIQPAKHIPPEPIISAEESTKAYVAELPIRSFEAFDEERDKFLQSESNNGKMIILTEDEENKIIKDILDDLEKRYYNPAEPRPETQVFYTYASVKAPMEIKAPVGQDYFVRLENHSLSPTAFYSGQPVMEAYIRGGTSLKIMDVPRGIHTLKYATGKTWRGPMMRFGKDTTYLKAYNDMDFSKPRNEKYVYTIELTEEPGGTLHTSSLSARDF